MSGVAASATKSTLTPFLPGPSRDGAAQQRAAATIVRDLVVARAEELGRARIGTAGNRLLAPPSGRVVEVGRGHARHRSRSQPVLGIVGVGIFAVVRQIAIRVVARTALFELSIMSPEFGRYSDPYHKGITTKSHFNLDTLPPM